MNINVHDPKGGPMLPGTLSVTPIPAPIQTSTPAHTLGSSATSAPTHMASNSLLPFGYWYGHAETKRNPLLMDRLIRNLGVNVWDRWDVDMIGKSYGLPRSKSLTYLGIWMFLFFDRKVFWPHC